MPHPKRYPIKLTLHCEWVIAIVIAVLNLECMISPRTLKEFVKAMHHYMTLLTNALRSFDENSKYFTPLNFEWNGNKSWFQLYSIVAFHYSWIYNYISSLLYIFYSGSVSCSIYNVLTILAIYQLLVSRYEKEQSG